MKKKGNTQTIAGIGAVTLLIALGSGTLAFAMTGTKGKSVQKNIIAPSSTGSAVSSTALTNTQKKEKDSPVNFEIRFAKGTRNPKKGDMAIKEAVCLAAEHIETLTGTKINDGTVDVSFFKMTAQCVDNKKELGSRCYLIEFEKRKNFIYRIEINSVTGKILSYFAFNTHRETKKEIEANKVLYDGYTDSRYSYGPGKNATDAERQKYYHTALAKKREEFEPIAIDFVKKKLGAKSVIRSYGIHPGDVLSSTGDGRDTLSLYCITDTNDTIYVTMDQITKEVTGYDRNPLNLNE